SLCSGRLWQNHAGQLHAESSGRLVGMTFTASKDADSQWVTKLTGHLADQAAFYGVLNTLYGMRFPLISAECSDCE
ncbi:MAG: hypothetical protein JSW55_01740, partial [Chloroflexota bacterium]